MKSIKIITGAFIIAGVLAGCGTKNGSYLNVSITYKNADKIPGRTASAPVKMLLEEVPYGGERPVLVDSATLPANDGKLVLKGNTGEEGIYELIIENGPVVLLVNDETDISVDIDLSKKDSYYRVSGSDASSQLKTFIETYGIKVTPVNLAFKELDSLKQFYAADSLVLASTNRKNNVVKELNTYLSNFITKSTHPAVSMFALGMSSRSLSTSDFETMLQSVVNKFPEHKTLARLKSNYDQQKAQTQAQAKESEKDGSWVGKPAPDLRMPSVNGDTLSIASFKGKYVLVDFWASWCGPCREENPAVLKAYQQFKNKNFTVLGVSLDKSKDAWIKAIKEDKLEWQHMSDLQFWDSKAVEVYKFQGIPFNVLVDPNGIVIAESLRGFDLEKKLSEVLK